MVARLIGPTLRSGLGSLDSETSPLQPNHSPPFCFSASNTPAANPPAAASPSWIGATRLETTTRRDMDESACNLLNLKEARGAPIRDGSLSPNQPIGHNRGVMCWSPAKTLTPRTCP